MFYLNGVALNFGRYGFFGTLISMHKYARHIIIWLALLCSNGPTISSSCPKISFYQIVNKNLPSLMSSRAPYFAIASTFILRIIFAAGALVREIICFARFLSWFARPALIGVDWQKLPIKTRNYIKKLHKKIRHLI